MTFILLSVSTLLWCVICVSFFWLTIEPDMRFPMGSMWSGHTLRVLQGQGTVVDDALQVQFDASGHALVEIPVAAFLAQRAATGLLQLHCRELKTHNQATLVWRARPVPSPLVLSAEPVVETMHQMPWPTTNWGSDYWLDVAAHPDWHGQITRLAIGLAGTPGTTVLIDYIALRPRTADTLMQYWLTSWATMAVWDQPAVNQYPGQTLSGQARTPLVALFTITTICLYLIWLGLRRQWRDHIDWRVIASLVCAGWLLLDFPWHWSLWRQLEVTRETFHGLTDAQRHRVAVDGVLYDFVELVKQHIPDPSARVFVVATDDYHGLRVSYHLYPLNVLWQRHHLTLPDAHWLHSGDYIVLFRADHVIVDRLRNRLRWGTDQSIAVTTLMMDYRGGLFRVL
jgi:hypothetical protein